LGTVTVEVFCTTASPVTDTTGRVAVTEPECAVPVQEVAPSAFVV